MSYRKRVLCGWSSGSVANVISNCTNTHAVGLLLNGTNRAVALGDYNLQSCACIR